MTDQTVLRFPDRTNAGLRRGRQCLLRGIRKGISIILCFVMLASNIVQSVAYAQDIIADGRTATQVDVNGNVTNITTTTQVNQNAFNSFSKFDVAAGHTVNLYLPSGAVNLLNLVYSDQHTTPSSIAGVLNSIKDGKIGGNVFFLNPYGIVVGEQGVVNVGSLTAITPTTSFMQSFFQSVGSPLESEVNKVLEGSVPVSNSGLITVKGKINAINDISLSAGSVESSGSILSGAVFQATPPDFSNVVNINDLQSGSVMSTENGDIVIKADHDIRILGGTIASSGSENLNAGSITLEAGSTISVANGQILAEGHGSNSESGDI